MRAVVDRSRCAGHAMCWQVDPELYPVDDLGYAARAEVDVPAGAEQAAADGAAACPERAIRLE